MKKLKIDYKRTSANVLPLDCWGIISSFLSSSKDFLLLCSTIRGFQQYSTTLNVNCASCVEFDMIGKKGIVALEKAQRSIPYVEDLSISGDFGRYELGKLTKSVCHYFPNVVDLQFNPEYHDDSGEDVLVSGFKNLERLTMIMNDNEDSDTTVRVRIQDNPILDDLELSIDTDASPNSIDFLLSNLPDLETLCLKNLNPIMPIEEDIRQNITKLTLSSCNADSLGINTMKNLIYLKVDLITFCLSSITRIFAKSLETFCVFEEMGCFSDIQHVNVTVGDIITLEKIKLDFPSHYLCENPTLFQFRDLPNVKHFIMKSDDEDEEYYTNVVHLTIEENWRRLETFDCIGFNVEFPNLANNYSSLRKLRLGWEEIGSGAIEYFPTAYPFIRDLRIQNFENLEKLTLFQFQGHFDFQSFSVITLDSLVSLNVVVSKETQNLLKFRGENFPNLKELKIALPYKNLKSFDLSGYMSLKHLETLCIKFWQKVHRGGRKVDRDKRFAILKKKQPSSSKFVITGKFFPSLKDFRLETCNSYQLVFSIVKIMNSKKIEHCEINGAETVLVNNCSSLEYLKIKRSKDLTIIDCSKLKKLKCLSTEIAYLEFEDSWKNSLKKLTIRNKNEQRLAYTTQAVIGFKNLQKLELENFFVKSFENLPELKVLKFSMTKEFSRTIENLPYVEDIRVPSHVRSYEPLFLKNLPKLKSFTWEGDEILEVKIDEISRSNLGTFGRTYDDDD